MNVWHRFNVLYIVLYTFLNINYDNNMKKYRIVEFGINKFIIEKRFLFFFWIDVCEKGQYTNTIFFNNVADAEIKIIGLKKGWSSKNKVVRYY